MRKLLLLLLAAVPLSGHAQTYTYDRITTLTCTYTVDRKGNKTLKRYDSAIVSLPTPRRVDFSQLVLGIEHIDTLRLRNTVKDTKDNPGDAYYYFDIVGKLNTDETYRALHGMLYGDRLALWGEMDAKGVTTTFEFHLLRNPRLTSDGYQY